MLTPVSTGGQLVRLCLMVQKCSPHTDSASVTDMLVKEVALSTKLLHSFQKEFCTEFAQQRFSNLAVCEHHLVFTRPRCQTNPAESLGIVKATPGDSREDHI